MKILTNIQSSAVAGISRVMSSFADYAGRHAVARGRADTLSLVGVAIDRAEECSEPERSCAKEDGMTLCTSAAVHEPLAEILKGASSLEDIHRAYLPVIDAYRAYIQEQRPDLVLLNGTYYLPWCLHQAAKAERVPAVLHYHGSLTKETEHWADDRRRQLMQAMEGSFDDRKLRYIFPSKLAKQVVEKDVFGHGLRSPRAIVLPNPIPDAFFKTDPVNSKRNIAFVGRWVRIKNTKFIERFAKLNAKLGDLFTVNVITDASRSSQARQKLQEFVRFRAQRTCDSALADFYAKMGAVLCPSFFETYGNVAQEAVAAGTPALVSGNMGVAEVFRDIGLDHLVTDFASPRAAFDQIKAATDSGVSESQRKALRETAGSDIVHGQFLDYLRA